jgi:hypothetical protein
MRDRFEESRESIEKFKTGDGGCREGVECA